MPLRRNVDVPLVDITELKRAEEALRLHAARFESLVNNAPMGVYLIDADFCISHVNPIGLRSFGNIADLVGCDFAEVMHIVWPKAMADKIIAQCRHTLYTGEPCVVSEVAEPHADHAATQHHEWQINRIPMPDGRHGVVCYFRDISELVQGLESIRQSEIRFRAFVTASSDVVYRMSPDWTEIRQLHGRDFVVDTNAPSGNWMSKYIHPDDHPKVRAAIEVAIRTKGIFEMEHRVLTVGGSVGWTSSRAVPLLSAQGEIVEWFGTASDVTEARRTRQALLDSEERYRTLFNSMDEGYCVIEMIFDQRNEPLDWRFLEVNPAFASLTGLENAGGKRMRELVPNHDAHWFETYGKVVLTGKAVRFVDQSKVLDGRWFDLYAFKVGGPESTKVAVLFTNISERKRAEASAIAALAEAERANRAKSNFLSSMSHELRSPLNTVLGFAQLLNSGTPAPTSSQQESVDHILKSGWYLLELINEILDLALIESGHLSLTLESVSLAEVLSDCQAMVELQAQQSGIRLTFPRFDNTCAVRADRTRVKQVVINLLSNAIKYNRPGGTVQVSCAEQADNRMRISVEDSGTGLSAGQLDHLFQPFERLGQEAGVIEGTGIGLVVSKRLVESMGGQIGASSTYGVGSKFWVDLVADSALRRLPGETVEPATPAPPAVGGTTADLAAQPARRSTVLCVEHDPANLMLMQRILARRTDLRLLLASDASHGVDVARATQPDVVLMDINLPGISGLQAMKLLSEDAATAHIPVIAVSANAMPLDVQSGLQMGFFRYLTKPLKIEQMMEALDAALQSPRADLTQSPRSEMPKAETP